MSNKSSPGRLTAIARERGISVIDLIREAMEAEGSLDAASRNLGVTRNTLRHHLKKAGLEFDIRPVVTFREVQS